MNHGKSGNKLNRNQTLRKATIRDLAKATLIQQRICTTKAKAKEARKLVDQLVTLGKKGTLTDKRRAFAILCDHQLVSELFNKTAPRFKSRIGGYTRIIHLGRRRGDNAELAFLELTEKEIIIAPVKTTAATAKKDDVKTVESKPKEVKVEKKVEEQHPVKKVDVKTDKTQNIASTEKSNPAKNIIGGIRKMFNRKTGGGG